jgi:hypothetical protein
MILVCRNEKIADLASGHASARQIWPWPDLLFADLTSGQKKIFLWY